jgi:hypothetical protein
MWGMLENFKELCMVERMSLEQAYAAFVRGEIPPILAIYAAKTNECECGNAAGTECFSDAHARMRVAMSFNITPCDKCACVGCSEGNCCAHDQAALDEQDRQAEEKFLQPIKDDQIKR